jgi:rsbT co-antagonist protein RsbR
MSTQGVNDAELAAQVADVELRLARARAVHAAIMDENPDAIAILQPDGSIALNGVGMRMMSDLAAPPENVDWAEAYGLFRADKTARYPQEELPLFRAMRGESVDDELVWMRAASWPEGKWLRITARPLAGGRGLAVFRDVSAEVALEEDIRSRTAALARSDEENRELIERLRVSLDELSTPVLELWEDVLVLPVIGLVDTQRSAQMTERALAEITRQRARFLVVDLTGVEVLDTSTADRFLRLARAVRLLGAECIVSGIQPAVARTLVEIGVSLEGLETKRNLRQALALCKRRLAELEAPPATARR